MAAALWPKDRNRRPVPSRHMPSPMAQIMSNLIETFGSINATRDYERLERDVVELLVDVLRPQSIRIFHLVHDGGVVRVCSAIDADAGGVRVASLPRDCDVLPAIEAFHSRAEDLKMLGQFDFVVTRGVAPLVQLMFWSNKFFNKKHKHGYPNGLLALKGAN